MTYIYPLTAHQAEQYTFPNYDKTKDPLNSQYVKPLPPPPPPPVPTTDYTPFIIGGAIVLFFFFKK